MFEQGVNSSFSLFEKIQCFRELAAHTVANFREYPPGLKNVFFPEYKLSAFLQFPWYSSFWHLLFSLISGIQPLVPQPVYCFLEVEQYCVKVKLFLAFIIAMGYQQISHVHIFIYFTLYYSETVLATFIWRTKSINENSVTWKRN